MSTKWDKKKTQTSYSIHESIKIKPNIRKKNKNEESRSIQLCSVILLNESNENLAFYPAV